MKKILVTLALAASMAAPAMAQETEAKDSVFVVKNGVVVGAFEVGEQADCLTFTKPTTPAEGNYAQFGDTKEELKSAVVIKQSGLLYVLASTVEGQTTYDEITSAGNYLFVAIPETLVGQDIKLSEYLDSEDFMQAYYMDNDYNTLAGASNWDLTDSYSEGTIRVDLTDSEVSVAVNFTADPNAEEVKPDFSATYSGPYPTDEEKSNALVYDGTSKELKSAFYVLNEEEATADFYLSIANITDAKLVTDSYQYVHVNVPYSALWQEGGFSITGDTEFLLDYVNYAEDAAFQLKKDSVGDATGTISIAMQGENTYTIEINIENLGASHTLTAYYSGEFLPYDLSTPNAYRLQNQEDVALKSAAVAHADGLYTIYLSQKESTSAAEIKESADIIVVTPEEFLNDGTKGFSGDETRAKVSVSYDGVTYNQANTTNGGDDALAIGGNADVVLADEQLTIDFMVFNIYQYSNANLSGHYEGKAVIIE